MTEDEGECLGCGGVDGDVFPCGVNGCDVLLHKHCGRTCESCSRVGCAEHMTVIEDCDVCAVCEPEFKRLAEIDRMAAEGRAA